ncbi:MAG TPA: TetR/AcrR family transcriptional regulator [Candidatus Dormibacteraeota bacterium]|nr:TetR/AcrR family transcriptional regulator [Candidatus Dormibacteraeota bacterium]
MKEAVRRRRVLGTRKVPRAVRETQMLEVAGRVFAARGFHEASMDEIAEAADISKPMLYNYFGSKEGLYFAYVDLSYREIVAAIDEAVAAAARAGEGPAQQLRTGVRAYYRYVGEHQDAFRVLFREMGDPGGQLAPQRHRLSRRVAAAIEAILSDLGSAPRMRTDALAEAFLGSARSLADWWLDNPDVPSDTVADQLMDLMLAGLRGLGAEPPG